MSEERTNMAIRDLKHYVIDNMSLDVQDDFEIICKYITNLQKKVEQLEKIRKEAIELINKNSQYPTYYLTGNIVKSLLNILNKGSENNE